MSVELKKLNLSNMSPETRTRATTAFFGLLLLFIFLIPGGHLGTSVVTAVLTAGISWELSKVFFTLTDAKEKQKILLGTAWLIVFINMIFPNSSIECLLTAFIFLFTYFLISAERHENELQAHFNEFIFFIFILIYAVIFMSFLPLLRRGNAGVHWLMMFLIMNWVGDSAAYFAGRKYGKQTLSTN